LPAAICPGRRAVHLCLFKARTKAQLQQHETPGGKVIGAIKVIGRRSSLFTRVVLFWAESLGVPWELEAVADLRAVDAARYAGNPALKLPVVQAGAGTVFGAQHACRMIARMSAHHARVVWPEDMQEIPAGNAHELAWQAMGTQVQLVMGTAINHLPVDAPYFAKARASLAGSLQWLDEHVDAVVQGLPERRHISLLEVALFCLFEHLQFRPSVPTAPYRNLAAFAEAYGTREAAARTSYRFDGAPG
jgi:glutathione S-transferase